MIQYNNSCGLYHTASAGVCNAVFNLVGRRVDRYKIQAEIGRGGMARVYRALDTVLGRQVALKVLSPQLANDPEFSARFRREGKIVAALQHPHIVTLFDVGETDGIQYLAMDFINGRSVYAVIRERDALPGETVTIIIRAIASALDYAHNQGAVHRDIKPQNILIDSNGRILLTDFGISVSSDDESGRLTRTGLFMGTPEYMSPEQVSGSVVDYRTDLYSLAITTYEMFSGEIPFRGNTPDLIVAHAQKLPPPLPTQRNGLPDALIDVLAKALAKDPAQRYQSGLDFSTAIDACFTQLPNTTVSSVLVAGLAQPLNTSPKVTRTIESADGATTDSNLPTAPTLNVATQPRRRNVPEARSNLPNRPLAYAQTIPLNFILPIGIGLIITFLILINTTFSSTNIPTTSTPTPTVTVSATASITQTSLPTITSAIIIIIPSDTVVVATSKPRATRVNATATLAPVVVDTATAIPATATMPPPTATVSTTLTPTYSPTLTFTPSLTSTPSTTKTAVSTITTAPTLTTTVAPSATETAIPSATPIPPTATTAPTITPP